MSFFIVNNNKPVRHAYYTHGITGKTVFGLIGIVATYKFHFSFAFFAVL
jgi:hypothetical protein